MSKEKVIDLPINRRDQFKKAYRYNFTFILKLSLLTSLFFLIPAVWLFMNSLIEGGILAKYNGDIALEWENLLMYRRFACLTIIPCSLIISLGLAGAFNVMKRFIENKGVMLGSDFGIGIRDNWKRYLLISLFYSVLITVLFVGTNMFNKTDQTMYYLAFLILSGLLTIILGIAWLYSLHIHISYESSCWECIYKGLIFSIRQIGWNLLMLLSGVAIFIVGYLLNVYLLNNNPIIIWVVILLFVVFGCGHSILVISLFIKDTFDKDINKKQFPEHYHAGLFDGENDE